MSNPSRFNRIGLSGPPGATNLPDTFLQIIVVPLPLVATTDVQDTGIVLPPRTHILSGFLNISESAAGGTTIINVGYVGGTGQELLNGLTANNAPGFRHQIGSSLRNDFSEISYALGSADWTAWSGELLLFVMSSLEETS